jgi:hypothetical protein
VPVSYRILLGFVVIVLLALPLGWVFGRLAAFGYLFGLAIMIAYLIYLLLFMEDSDDH